MRQRSKPRRSRQRYSRRSQRAPLVRHVEGGWPLLAGAAACGVLVLLVAAVSCRRSAEEQPQPVAASAEPAEPETDTFQAKAESDNTPAESRPPPADPSPLAEPAATPPEPSASAPRPPSPPGEPGDGSRQGPSAGAARSDATAAGEVSPQEIQETIEAFKAEAERVAEKVCQDFPGEADSLILMGNVHKRHGRAEAALECWQRCVEVDAGRVDAYHAMAQIALEKEEYEKALLLWRRAEELAPDLAEVHFGIGRALMHMGKPEEAIVAFREALRLSPQSGMCHFLLGQAYLQTDDYEKAKQHCQEAAEIQPDLWNTYYVLATVCARLGQMDEAKQCRGKFKQLKAAEMNDSIDRLLAYDDLAVARGMLVGTHLEAAAVYQRHGAGTAAERHWLRAAELDPHDRRSRESLSAFYQASSRDREALEVYRQLRSIDPKNPWYCVNLGIAHARLQEFDAAEQAFLEAEQLAPQQAAAYRARAQLYLRVNKNLPRAQTLARKAVELEPSGQNYFVLAAACDKNGDRRGGLAAMRRAVELEPDNADYRRVYRLLQQRQ